MQKLYFSNRNIKKHVKTTVADAFKLTDFEEMLIALGAKARHLHLIQGRLSAAVDIVPIHLWAPDGPAL